MIHHHVMRVRSVLWSSTLLSTWVVLACASASPRATSPAPQATPPNSAATQAPTPDGDAGQDSGARTPPNTAARRRRPEPQGDAPVHAANEREFRPQKSQSARGAHGVSPSSIKPTATEAALKFFVLDKDKGPIPGLVISLTGADHRTFYAPETDALGYTEVLVPVGQEYKLVYLSLGREDISAKVPVSDEPNQNIKLTLRYKRHDYDTSTSTQFVLHGVHFDTGKATIRPESFARLDRVVEYMQHRPSVRIELSGHTDNVGNPKANQLLSERRAKACREYIMSRGIEGSRLEAVGFGAARPIASNSTEEGRQANRRIEASVL